MLWAWGDAQTVRAMVINIPVGAEITGLGLPLFVVLEGEKSCRESWDSSTHWRYAHVSGSQVRSMRAFDDI
ncbi:MAG TPA: hypothetical protein DCG90_16215 [Sphingobium sp.]|jgi:hypothetical protein|nr:hypothetical protein [Sphingobium sp.]